MNPIDGSRRAALRRALTTTLALVGTGVSAAITPAEDRIEIREVKFAAGATSARVTGAIRGRQTVDHTVQVTHGQTLSVKLRSRHPGLAFNVLPPGSNSVALDGAVGLTEWSGAVPAGGIHAVRVYLSRANARRAERADYTLEIALATVTPAPPAAPPAPASPAGPAGPVDAPAPAASPAPAPAASPAASAAAPVRPAR